MTLTAKLLLLCALAWFSSLLGWSYALYLSKNIACGPMIAVSTAAALFATICAVMETP